MHRDFVYCPSCGEVGRAGSLAGGFAPDLADPEADDRESAGDFERRHADHGARRLRLRSHEYVSEAAYGSQAALAFHTGLDGGVGWVIEAARRAPGRPVRYRVLEGRLARTREAIGVDSASIARLIADAAGCPVDAGIAGIAESLARSVAASAGAAGFERLAEAAVAGPGPLVAHAPLPGEALRQVREAGRRLFGGARSGAASRALGPGRFSALLEQHAGPGAAFAPILETGYALLDAGGRVERHLRRVRPRPT